MIYTCTTQNVTWLSKVFDRVHDVSAVALSRDDQRNMLKCLGSDGNGVALGR